MTPPRFWLQRLELQNYRGFKHLTVDFDERLTVLIARNGLGKTAVLDAISVAFGPFVGSFHTGKSVGIDPADVRLLLTNPQLREMEQQYPASIKAQTKLEVRGTPNSDKEYDISSIRHLNAKKSKTTIKEAHLSKFGWLMQRAITNNEPIILPLVTYYGTGRLWHEKKKIDRKIFKSEFFSRTSGYQDCLDPASSFKYVKDWLKYATEADSEERNLWREKQGFAHRETGTAYTSLLFAIRQAVDECLSLTGWQGLRYSFKHQTVVMEHPQQGVLEVSQLSDGVRNMIGLVADIAYRAVRLNSHFGQDAPKKTPGIVLIDEVDMHLHPEWQQVVLTNLTKAFPALQFIVTTHSPQVLTTVPAKSIRCLESEWDEESGSEQIVVKPVDWETLGVSSHDTLAILMGTDPIPNVEPARQLSRYKALIQQGLHEQGDGLDLRARLDQHFGPQHPVMLECDRLIRLQNFKRQLPKRG
jgi:predicted ATP-binding protein involved in virulence